MSLRTKEFSEPSGIVASMTPEDQLRSFLQPYPVYIQELLLAVRSRLKERLPDACEIIWDATQVVGSEFSWSEKGRSGFIHLPAYAKHVNLGFSWGASLPDPHGLLKGSGSRVRHITLKSLEDYDDPRVQVLIDEAVAQSGRPDQPIPPSVTVKVMKGPKRRPKPG